MSQQKKPSSIIRRIFSKENVKAVVKILFIIILLESTLFNIRYWATMGASLDASQLEITLGGNVIEVDGLFQPTGYNAEITFSGIGTNVRTVYIRPDFGDSEIKIMDVGIRPRDENQIHTHTVQLINGYERSFYIPIGTMGAVDELTIILMDDQIGIQEVHFNIPIPWTFQMLRVVFLTFIIGTIYFWKKYQFSKILFNSKSKLQWILPITILSLFIGILLFTLIFSVDSGWIPGSDNPIQWNPSRAGHHGINDRVVDAILARQLHLDIEVHESLLNARLPYSATYRDENNVEALWDHVYFEGRYYSYFGIVPVLILFLPYHLITSNYLSATAATLIFSALGAIGMLLLWRELVVKYLKDIPYTLYLAGLVCSLFGSNLMLLTIRAHNYESASSSSFMFSVWGIFLILRSAKHESIDKIKRLPLFFGGICLGLAVGSRPTSIFVALLIPALLFPLLRNYRPFKKLIKDKQAFKTTCINLMPFVIPYVVIGLGLMWHNYARFGSITEFGSTYHITSENNTVVTQVGALGMIRRAYDGLFSFLLTSYTLEPVFPFLRANNSQNLFMGHFARTATIGLFSLPITWFLFPMITMRTIRRKKAFPLMIAMTTAALIIIISTAILVGVLGRYTVDFAWLLILPSLLCMGFVYKNSAKYGDRIMTVVRRLSFMAIGFSCLILFAWGMVGEGNNIWRHNPAIFQFLSDLISFF